MERRNCFMKYMVIVMISLFTTSHTYAQKPTIADDKWTEETFDEAYSAPTTLITKTWYESDGTGYVFNANKTFSMTFTATLRDYDLKPEFGISFGIYNNVRARVYPSLAMRIGSSHDENRQFTNRESPVYKSGIASFTKWQ